MNSKSSDNSSGNQDYNSLVKKRLITYKPYSLKYL